jgi:hypothetical protein
MIRGASLIIWLIANSQKLLEVNPGLNLPGDKTSKNSKDLSEPKTRIEFMREDYRIGKDIQA